MSFVKTNLIGLAWISICICVAEVEAQTQPALRMDSCMLNDVCETAITIPNVITEEQFVCVTGCTIGAQPEGFNNACQIGVFPTVWFQVATDDFATVMNIHVESDAFDSPVISVFQQVTDCSDKVPIGLTDYNYSCVRGANGKAEAFGTDVSGNTVYYIAITSSNSPGGSFELCVSTQSQISACVTNRDIEIVSRSDGGPLEGPFNPGETISVCMNVNAYSASGNGCQWFHGLVPVFGNGWDPSSFDVNGQPLNATINGTAIGSAGNGLYGAATWDWFTDVDYHYDNPWLQILDLDGNGVVDLCNISYDPDCPNLGGITGGCCGPCWGSPLGDILPGGWFAYGMNGTCPTPGPPVRVDWGDGNTCGSGMGPWHFCFDLEVREYPQCLQDSTTDDLSLTFFTFSDGETGSWTGSASICAFDPPTSLDFGINCFETIDLGIETLPDFCAGDTLIYTVFHPEVSNWSWQVSPPYAVLNPILEGDNGYIIQSKLYSPTAGPITVFCNFTGHNENSTKIFYKTLRFRIGTPVIASLPQTIHVCEDSKDTLHIEPAFTQGGFPPYTFLWLPGGETSSSVVVLPPHQPTTRELIITDEAGCTAHEVVHMELKPCLLDTIKPTDESNEEPTEEDPPIDDGNFSQTKIENRSETSMVENELKVFPVPATDEVLIEWSSVGSNAVDLILFDLNGHIMQKNSLSSMDKQIRMRKMNISKYAPGIYMVVLQTKDSFFVSRMVKM